MGDDTTICGKTFRSYAALCQHWDVHKGRKKFACGSCGKRYGTAPSMIRCEKECVDKAKDKPEGKKCTLCSYYALSEKEMKTHMDNKHKPVACEDCGKKIAKAYDLKRHKESGACKSDKNPAQLVPCKFCDQQIPKGTQANHNRKHHPKPSVKAAKQEKLKCSECGEQFDNKPTLHSHQRVHHKRQ